MTNSYKKILLFHPPSFGKYTIQLDGYCSQRQKGAFRWHPVDFVAFQSFYRKKIEVEILDCGDERSVNSAFFKKMRDKNNLVIGLIGCHGFEEQVSFYSKLLNLNENIILTGDIARSNPEFVFSKIKSLRYILPELSQPPEIEDIIQIRSSDKLWLKGNDSFRKPAEKEFSIGVQDYSLWKTKKYTIPFSLNKGFASVITQVGCPYKCPYCIMHSYNLSIRDYNEVDQELKSLYESGVRHLYIRDATFNSSVDHVKKIVDLIKKYKFQWNAFFDIRTIKEYLPYIAESNLLVSMIGFDFTNNRDRKNNNKEIKCSEKEIVKLLHNNNIKVAGHYLLLNNKTRNVRELVKTAIKLNLDWFTYSPIEIRPGSNKFLPDKKIFQNKTENLSSKLFILIFYLNPLNFFSIYLYYFKNIKSYVKSFIKLFFIK